MKKTADPLADIPFLDLGTGAPQPTIEGPPPEAPKAPEESVLDARILELLESCQEALQAQTRALRELTRELKKRGR